MKRTTAYLLSAVLLSSVPQSILAGYTSTPLPVSNLFRGNVTWTQIVGTLIRTLGITIFFVAAAAFLIGALMYVSGFISEENKSKGKNLMIGALFGMAIVLSAQAIFNAAYFFVYNT